VGLGVICTGTHHIPDEMFLIAAQELANFVEPSDIERGSLYPPLSSIREVSMNIAVGVTKCAYDRGNIRTTLNLFYKKEYLTNLIYILFRLGIYLSGAAGQAQVAGEPTVQLQLRELHAGFMGLAPDALH